MGNDEEYNKYEKAEMKSKVAQTYLNHVAASYWYDRDDREYVPSAIAMVFKIQQLRKIILIRCH